MPIVVRPEFAAIVSGWTLVDDFDDLSRRIEETAEFADGHGGLLESETKIVEMMIDCQIARGIARGDFEPFLSGKYK